MAEENTGIYIVVWFEFGKKELFYNFMIFRNHFSLKTVLEIAEIVLNL
jgi:hypothetical protein